MNAGIRGRGASGNLPNRFEQIEYVEEPGSQAPEPSRLKTRLYKDDTKSIVARNNSPDVGFDASVNPYRGCEHGCAYCYARPTHEYLGFSPGLDFETKIMVKERAPELLRKALESPRWRPEPLGLSGVTDPYQPAERKLKLTRHCLEVLAEFRNPVAIITKNRLVTRDIDILRELANVNAVAVYLSLTTLDLKLNRRLEPRTSSPAQRLQAIQSLSEAGIPVGVLIAPIIPGLTDHEVPKLVDAAAEAGARFAGHIVLRLPLAVAPLFEQWLVTHEPGRKTKVLNRIRSIRGGRLYDARFQTRMTGEGPFAAQIVSMFGIACRKAGIQGARPSLSTDHFRRPIRRGDQLALFA